MALATTTVSFSNEPPTMEALEIKLAAATGLDVRVEFLHSFPPTETWYFHFSSQIDKFSRSIKCNRNGRKFSVYEADNVNRCPLYFLFATEAVLTDLGGVQTDCEDNINTTADPPEYARVTFQQWKTLNGGIPHDPPKWKTGLIMLGVIILWLLAVVLGVVLFPILMIVALFARWKTRKQTK